MSQSIGSPSQLLGYPQNDSHRWGRGWAQDFVGGAYGVAIVMLADEATAAFAVEDVLRDEFVRLGGATGVLGYPVADAVRSGGTMTQEFEHGRLTVTDGQAVAALCLRGEGQSCPTAEAAPTDRVGLTRS